jgi:polysaccharide pyruvyl transferase CsaB
LGINRPRALICGYYGHYNLGDEAMLAGMLSQLRQWRPELSYTVYSNHPDDTQQRHGVNTLCNTPPRRRIERWQRQWQPAQAMLTHRYFVLGGGDLLRDGTEQSVASVWLEPLRQAIALRRKTLVWGVSVGKLWRDETKRQIRQVLNQTDLVVVRDRNSQTQLQTLGIERPIHVMHDLALLGPSPQPFSPPSSSPSNRPIKIGISFRALTNRNAQTNAQTNAADAFAAFAQAMAQIIDTLIDTYQAEIHLLPLQSFPADYRQRHRPTEDDYIDMLALQQQCRHGSRIQIQPYFASLHDFYQTLSQYDVILGTRLHALILAAGLGIPMIAAAYDPKVSSFMNEIGQQAYSIDLESFTPEAVLAKLSTLLADSVIAQNHLQAGLNTYRQIPPDTLNALKAFWHH